MRIWAETSMEQTFTPQRNRSIKNSLCCSMSETKVCAARVLFGGKSVLNYLRWHWDQTEKSSLRSWIIINKHLIQLMNLQHHAKFKRTQKRDPWQNFNWKFSLPIFFVFWGDENNVATIKSSFDVICISESSSLSRTCFMTFKNVFFNS